jgi:hypothetical protein
MKIMLIVIMMIVWHVKILLQGQKKKYVHCNSSQVKKKLGVGIIILNYLAKASFLQDMLLGMFVCFCFFCM